jgi:hypothetical protein
LALFLGDDSAEVLNNNGIFLLNAAIKWARGGGSISASMVSSPVGSIDLTAAGIIDWAHWGRNGPSTFDHKAGVTPQKITNVTKIGTGGLSWFADCPTTFSWTDGTPTLNVSNTPTGINTNGAVGNGFEITVPADTTTKTLRVYVGVWFTQGKLEATLSDVSAPAYVKYHIEQQRRIKLWAVHNQLQSCIDRANFENPIHHSDSVFLAERQCGMGSGYIAVGILKKRQHEGFPLVRR